MATARRPRCGYRCHFCRDRLVPARRQGHDWLLAGLMLRKHYCPHCFEITVRPVGLLRWLIWPFATIFRVFRRLAIRRSGARRLR